MNILCFLLLLVIVGLGIWAWLIGAFEGGKSAIRAAISRIKPQ